ncbi:MAG: hypothetical protein SNJ78_05160 [Spirochaetales bacterium]
MEWIWVILIALTFYGFFPGIGAFLTRSKWRTFRRDFIQSSFFPLATYSSLSKMEESSADSSREFRFFGALEALQEDNTIWLRAENLVLSADMTGQDLFLLPSGERVREQAIEELHLPLSQEEIPIIIPWNRVSTLSEGTKVYIAGPLETKQGKRVFRATLSKKLLVIFYDGEERDLLKRIIWNSRHRNEYWNVFTPASIGLGVLAEMILTYYFLHSPPLRITAILAIAGALFPILPFLPPGFFLFALYRWLWGKARFLRAERDLLRLPLRFFPRPDLSQRVRLPNGENYFCLSLSSVPLEVLEKRGFIRRTLLQKEKYFKKIYKEGDSDKPSFYWFGVEKEGQNDPYPGISKDPMVENLVVEGNPGKVAAVCEKFAYILEILSSLCFGIGVGVNLFLALRLISLIVR